MNSTNQIVSPALEKIAMSLSGGGYRAASFHLGSMSYMHRLQYKGKPLLENVKMISTVSGGTITGIVYAIGKNEQKSFEDIYRFLMDNLRQLDLIKMSLEKLNPGAQWNNRNKRKNLINAFAELYDKHFTQGKTFGQLTLNSHLEAVVFNSTEFNHGINFRFRDAKSGFFGNKYMPIEPAVSAEVKLADAMASSACFPGGFEPMVWPHDFVHDQSPNLAQLARTQEPVGIMDGGIYDNQGIDSILGYRKNDATPYFDLVIISDVASPYMDPYKPTADKAKTGARSLTLNDAFRKIKRGNRTINIVLLLLVALPALLPLTCGYGNNLYTGFGLGFSAMALVILLAKLVLVQKLKSGIAWLKENTIQKIPSFYLEKLKHLNVGALSIRRVEPLLLDRAMSLVTLLMDVFLKVVRRLNYNKLYENDRYAYRRISNLVKELTQEDFTQKTARRTDNATGKPAANADSVLNGSYADVVGPQIQKVAESASDFGTTLWFSDTDELNPMLDQLVATGQFNMCYNLLEYLEKIIFDPNSGFAALPPEEHDELLALHKRCETDWLRFKQTPLFMVTHLSA